MKEEFGQEQGPRREEVKEETKNKGGRGQILNHGQAPSRSTQRLIDHSLKDISDHSNMIGRCTAEA